jgi:hypothetical protein
MSCTRCDSTIVMLLNADFVCDCNVRSLAKIASPEVVRSLRRAMALVRDEHPRCDRCNQWDAVRLVRCYLGCSHAQCALCAECTTEERQEQLAYGASVRNGGGLPRPEAPGIHRPGRPDTRKELMGRLA